ncbi:hypothetical protein PPACK8108_LOCUS2549 [Phakopsora pachyrhizi]|uniref:Uncharacterized protein n=1 Tax=Phakopsora pachyrhizi TaxID=170000 RepID=A0AAV0AKE2_PHAPC|nr:hypothetical protein PPACK8108_LOCUS2549 [Phakopsora pachyrhizi]
MIISSSTSSSSSSSSHTLSTVSASSSSITTTATVTSSHCKGQTDESGLGLIRKNDEKVWNSYEGEGSELSERLRYTILKNRKSLIEQFSGIDRMIDDFDLRLDTIKCCKSRIREVEEEGVVDGICEDGLVRIRRSGNEEIRLKRRERYVVVSTCKIGW